MSVRKRRFVTGRICCAQRAVDIAIRITPGSRRPAVATVESGVPAAPAPSSTAAELVTNAASSAATISRFGIRLVLWPA